MASPTASAAMPLAEDGIGDPLVGADDVLGERSRRAAQRRRLELGMLEQHLDPGSTGRRCYWYQVDDGAARATRPDGRADRQAASRNQSALVIRDGRLPDPQVHGDLPLLEPSGEQPVDLFSQFGRDHRVLPGASGCLHQGNASNAGPE